MSKMYLYDYFIFYMHCTHGFCEHSMSNTLAHFNTLVYRNDDRSGTSRQIIFAWHLHIWINLFSFPFEPEHYLAINTHTHTYQWKLYA